MKFQPDTPAADRNAIVAHEEGVIHVFHDGALHPHTQSVIVPWQGQVQSWGVALHADLTENDFTRLAQWQPELVIFGSGSRLRFAPPPLIRGLIRQRIGLETMDTAAACRTCNVLVAEGRRVVAALLLGD
ncbi:Mth938-like domain-containing protein [Amphibiibacter pelophylacis]|uniref:MTH938/NDUFAF3 family protein n=1 Tax=Amphibiibacter pelophylacis TaxID=1799477 RepID=A0ACC6NZ28_9BURK